ncbi:Catenin-beta-like protein [Cokeromyces recurvatus]|uniref:Catenin-beta-like protein n=1 Tax=Cokeromyces recurvatus TaxID=90255 RepID=UPI0022205C7A|nr:Catenin-beta-like protein [Cokeromyces recurvatus]KAI7903181.1 Catenin-beta-like protein [Cokeromyces recurvatus]
MNIDDIFKIPAIPAGRNKRKMPATPDIDFFNKYKATEATTEIAESSKSNMDDEHYSKRRYIGDDDEDLAYTAEKYQDNAEFEDEEGRFFGGGLTEEQSNILDLVDEYELEETEVLSINNIKKMILKFEKTINKNQEMRVRYADQPEKFMESEADLDEEIKNLLTLTEAPHMYPELIKLGTVNSLMSLLSHENTDIAIDTIDLINELIDEDVGTTEEDLERSDQVQKSIKAFVDAMLEGELLQLLVQNLGRMNEEEESDRQGVFKILSIFENIISLDPKYAENIALKTDILPWLLKRLQVKGFDANIEYASEILSILLQDNREIRLKVGELDGVDILLRALSVYRRKDASSEDESEMVENFFNALCSLLNEVENKKRFLESEGIELMIIMMKERTLARIRAVKVLNYALNGVESRERCIRFVDASGLKVLFPLFMGKGNKKLKKSHHSAFSESEDEEHISCIILSLLRNLTQTDVQRMRVILKFTEDNFEKVDRLIEMKEQYEKRDEAVKQELEEAKTRMDEEEYEEFEEDFYVRRLDAGLFTLQRICLLIAALSEENKGIREKAIMLLKRNGQDMRSVFKIIEEETALMADFVSLRYLARGESNNHNTTNDEKN